jgi:hypothetical protein
LDQKGKRKKQKKEEKDAAHEQSAIEAAPCGNIESVKHNKSTESEIETSEDESLGT